MLIFCKPLFSLWSINYFHYSSLSFLLFPLVRHIVYAVYITTGKLLFCISSFMVLCNLLLFITSCFCRNHNIRLVSSAQFLSLLGFGYSLLPLSILEMCKYDLVNTCAPTNTQEDEINEDFYDCIQSTV